MLKRVQLIPLLAMLWCGGISLSGGLNYTNINIAAYLLPIALIFGVYYISHAVMRNIKKRELMSMVVCAVLSLAGLALLHKSIMGGFGLIYNDLSYRILVCYGIDLGRVAAKGAGVPALAIGQFEAFVTFITLYLYETHRPALLTALPSFFLFSLSIIADGTPYETCIIAYSGALIVFLGMGSRGESIRKFVLLSACTVIVGLLVGRLVSWDSVSVRLWSYRDRITEAGNIRSVGQGQDGNRDKNKQRIDFGQFNEEGDINYNGTVELTVVSHEKLEAEQLFLRQFIGNSFKNNVWAGIKMEDSLDGRGIGFEPLETIEIKSVFDQETFVPYAVPSDEFGKRILDEVMNYPVQKGWQEERDELAVREGLAKRIRSTVLAGKKYETVGEAVDTVKEYFGKGFTYTLQPGALQDGVDEVEWFMFSTKKGYCTHFSSAAVMIFRTMGIPARLAQGYMIDGRQIITDKEVEVYDYNAHSWVEIRIADECWIPLDVTSYAENDVSGRLEDIFRRNDGQQSTPQSTISSLATPPVKPDGGAGKYVEGRQEGREEKPDESRTDGEPVWRQEVGRFTYFLLLVPAAAVVLLMVRLRRKRKYRALKAGLESGAYAERLLCANDALTAFWKEIAAPWDYLDSEKRVGEIFERTKRYYYSFMQTGEQELVLREKIRRYVLCVYESRFGRHGISEQEYGQCMEYLEELIYNIEECVQKKQWKKLRRCDMVKIIRERESGAESAENRR